MAKKIFTEKQREIVARKLGYKGPMSEFETFVQSDPAMERRVRLFAEKMVAKGGYIKKFAEGGSAEDTVEQIYADILGREADAGGKQFYTEQLKQGKSAEQIRAEISASDEAKAKAAQPKTSATTPQKPTVTPANVEKITPTKGQDVKFTSAATSTMKTPSTAKTTKAVAPEVKEYEDIEAVKSQTEIENVVDANEAIIGEVSEKAQVAAATMTPAETELMNVEAARLENPREVVGAPIRELQAEELVSGPSVNNAQVEATLNKAVAATASVNPEMTLQGQLDKLLQNFDSGNPPAWAASSLRNANAVLSARGIGASSIAGQAIIQATLEAAVPIAAQDAQTVATLELQNLSNRQQVAVLVAQQRAAFLGQEFDQAFQARVTNAAKISDIANQNFSAGVQIALENARLAQTVDLANLNNRQAVVMAQAAQISNIELANLNNRQQAAVQNAQAFLQMDLTNLSNQQQMAVINAQAKIQSVFTDTAMENATRQFNATSEIQVDQFYDSLITQVSQFNAAQANAMAQFNAAQENAAEQFNAAQTNSMAQFNAQNRLIVDQSNAEWRRQISTINTAAQNNANMFDAQAGLQVTMTEYNNMWQSMRDQMEYTFKASESFYDRQNTLAIALLQKQAAIEAAKFTLEGEKYKALGQLTATALSGTSIASDVYNFGKSVIKDLSGAGVGLPEGDTGSMSADIISESGLKSGDLYGSLDDSVTSMDWMGADTLPDYYDVGDFPTDNFDTFGSDTSFA